MLQERNEKENRGEAEPMFIRAFGEFEIHASSF
jgi:hypothetical protein